MAVYKVPQDVEAEDKLLGPFSFRQFVYLIIAFLAGFLAYLLSKLFIALIIVPLPIVVFFLVLALPLKKDQPMETYLTAIVHFLLKPRIRLWDPEGELNLVEITAVRVDEGPALKGFTGHEASERLRYLSQVVDTGGWASRGLSSPIDNISLNDTVVAEAQSAEDMFDTQGAIAQNIDTMITRSDQAHKQAIIQTMQVPPPQPASAVPLMSSQQLYGMAQTDSVMASSYQPDTPLQTYASQPPLQDNSAHLSFNPYPGSMHQKVISPSGPRETTRPKATPTISRPAPQAEQPQASSGETIPPDIMRLATSKDLSISTIAREAERLHKKHLEEGNEVVISLR